MNNSDWEIVFKGKLIAIEQNSKKGFERAVRMPGVRLILNNKEGKLLLTKEFRHEQGKHDYRLPGGKVFDDLDSYLEVRSNYELITKAVYDAAKIEAKEEAGIDNIENLNIASKSSSGALVEWDLYYLTGEVESLGEQDLKEDELKDGIDVGFFSKEEILEMIKNNEISEDRSASVLFRHVY